MTSQLPAAGIFFIENLVANPSGGALIGKNATGNWSQAGQTFELSQTATLHYAEFHLNPADGWLPGDPSMYHASLFIGDFVGPLASSVGFTTSPDLANYKRFTFDPILIAPGEYTIILSVDEGPQSVGMGLGVFVPHPIFGSDAFAGGARIGSTDGGVTWTRIPESDSAFRVAFVPEPCSIALLMFSVLPFLLARKRIVGIPE